MDVLSFSDDLGRAYSRYTESRVYSGVTVADGGRSLPKLTGRSLAKVRCGSMSAK
jgi:hypothetical protein